MGNLRGPDTLTSPTSPSNGGAGYSNGGDAMSAFYSEVSCGSTRRTGICGLTAHPRRSRLSRTPLARTTRTSIALRTCTRAL